MKKGVKKAVKGLSPVIATVLLIVLVIVIALIVFLWVRGMTQEAITKFGDVGDPVNIQLVCNQVSFEASYTPATGLYIRNPGSVPIFGMDVKIEGDGSHRTLDLRDDAENWPEVGLNTGGVFMDEMFSDYVTDGDDITLIPVLIGESESGRKTYVCDEKQHGYTLVA